MRDLAHPRWMFVKAALFVAIGIVAAALLIAQSPRIETAILIVLCVWSFARVYYFLFYVIERFIDPEFRFSGVGAAVWWLWRRRR